jgi:hypothetical protein
MQIINFIDLRAAGSFEPFDRDPSGPCSDSWPPFQFYCFDINNRNVNNIRIMIIVLLGHLSCHDEEVGDEKES